MPSISSRSGSTGLPPPERERLDELHSFVMDLLDRPAVTGLESRNLVERRRAEAMRIAGPARHVADRVQHAPRAYLLAQEAPDVARQAALVEPLPIRGSVRVAVLPLDPLEWRVEVAAVIVPACSPWCRACSPTMDSTSWMRWSRRGRMAELSTRSAYGDPSSSPLVSPVRRSRGSRRPRRQRSNQTSPAAFNGPLEVLPNPDADVRFDDDASPWYTLCEVRSPDRRGLLHSLTAGIASAGANVHSARLVTISGYAVDRFELTDRNGHKLEEPAKRLIVDAIRGGVSPRRRRLGRRR